MIDEHGESILSDFRRYYGIDLSDVLVPESGLTPRKALAFLRNLPLDSATSAALRGGDQFRGWDGNLYMLANILDAVRENTYVLVASNSKSKPKAPTPVDRPKAATKKSPMANKFAAMARIAHARSRNRKKDTDGGPRG